VAASASAVGIYRVAGDVTALRRKVEGLVGEGVQLEVLSCADPFRFYVPDGFPSKVVAFGSDAPYLAPLGKVLMAGPGSIHFAHRDDEQITLAELEEGVDLYVRLVRSLLGVRVREPR
jgi:acetylornithine deacetylase